MAASLCTQMMRRTFSALFVSFTKTPRDARGWYAMPLRGFSINGKRLADLMIEYRIGVSAIRTITLQRLDSDYFEDE
jgi:restriction endonuclease Mrr